MITTRPPTGRSYIYLTLIVLARSVLGWGKNAWDEPVCYGETIGRLRRQHTLGLGLHARAHAQPTLTLRATANSPVREAQQNALFIDRPIFKSR